MRMTLFTLFFVLLTGCASKEPVVLNRVSQSQTCHSEHRLFTIDVIEDQETWKQYFAQKFAYGELPSPRLPAVDLTTETLIIIDMGERPNSGYSMHLSEHDAVLEKGVLTITVSTTSPQEGVIYAQMLTHPCMAITIPKSDYRAIHVVDQNDIVLATLQTPRQRQ